MLPIIAGHPDNNGQLPLRDSGDSASPCATAVRCAGDRRDDRFSDAIGLRLDIEPGSVDRHWFPIDRDFGAGRRIPQTSPRNQSAAEVG